MRGKGLVISFIWQQGRLRVYTDMVELGGDMMMTEWVVG
jgi:hypothetical protein